MPSTDLLDRLAAFATFEGVPRAQLAWLADHGERRLAVQNEVLASPGDPLAALWVVMAGHLAIRISHGAGTRKALEWRAGEVTGVLPYSRLSKAPGTTTAEEASELLSVHRDHFPEMISTCHELTSVFVHIMLDRARRFTATDLQDEKLLSLGRLAAGLAHELNNPASAVVRSAEELTARLDDTQAAYRKLGSLGLDAQQLALIEKAAEVCVTTLDTSVRSPLERADREDQFADWLVTHGADEAAAEALAESALALEAMDQLAGVLDGTALDTTLRALASGCATRRLASEIERAATRMHGLVASVKGFTYMDQGTDAQPVDIARGLIDTLNVLRSKARGKLASIDIQVPSGLPVIDGFGGALNQVWANLIENALDAVAERGHVQVSAAVEGDRLVVRVIDNGPGIPAEIQSRIFDPFFTTKPVGQGTGLGLDIARRVVTQHDGGIELESVPGRTEFRVSLPISHKCR